MTRPARGVLVPPNGSLWAAIDSAHHDKFSPNLFAWFSKQCRALDNGQWVPNVFRGSNYHYISSRDQSMADDLLDLTGANVWDICRKGPRATLWSISSAVVPDDNFWMRYKKEGRCALDPKHQASFTRDENRYRVFATATGTHRQCTWCGDLFAEQSYTITRHRWVKAALPAIRWGIWEERPTGESQWTEFAGETLLFHDLREAEAERTRYMEVFAPRGFSYALKPYSQEAP